jgi:hypothetical protein
VLDVQPKLGARVRRLATGASNKNDPNDALSVAVAALRSKTRRLVTASVGRTHMSRSQGRRKAAGPQRWPAALARSAGP